MEPWLLHRVLGFEMAKIHCGLTLLLTTLVGLCAAPGGTSASEPPTVPTKPLDRRIGIADSTHASRATFQYPSPKALSHAAEPALSPSVLAGRRSLGETTADGVPYGLIGAAAGTILGYLSSGWGTDQILISRDDTRPGYSQNRSGLDGSALAAGAFLGWSAGISVGIRSEADDADMFGSFLASVGIAGVAVALANQTESETVYIPAAVLQVVFVAAMRR